MIISTSGLLINPFSRIVKDSTLEIMMFVARKMTSLFWFDIFYFVTCEPTTYL